MQIKGTKWCDTELNFLRILQTLEMFHQKQNNLRVNLLKQAVSSSGEDKCLCKLPIIQLKYPSNVTECSFCTKAGEKSRLAEQWGEVKYTVSLW